MCAQKNGHFPLAIEFLGIYSCKFNVEHSIMTQVSLIKIPQLCKFQRLINEVLVFFYLNTLGLKLWIRPFPMPCRSIINTTTSGTNTYMSFNIVMIGSYIWLLVIHVLRFVTSFNPFPFEVWFPSLLPPWHEKNEKHKSTIFIEHLAQIHVYWKILKNQTEYKSLQDKHRSLISISSK
jgi:hypothetical protein